MIHQDEMVIFDQEQKPVMLVCAGCGDKVEIMNANIVHYLSRVWCDTCMKARIYGAIAVLICMFGAVSIALWRAL